MLAGAGAASGAPARLASLHAMSAAAGAITFVGRRRVSATSKMMMPADYPSGEEATAGFQRGPFSGFPIAAITRVRPSIIDMAAI